MSDVASRHHRAVRRLPPGVVLDGELIVWERGRTNFALLQRRLTAGRTLLRLAHDYPAHYVLFDLLADTGGEVALGLPLSERRARLERLLVDAPTQLTLTPQTTDTQQVSEWLVNWTVAAGIEGVVSKRLTGRYEPGRRGWWKYRTRITTEVVAGGVTGSLRDPATVLLGRRDRRGRLRYTGRTHPLSAAQREELGGMLSPLRAAQRRGAPVLHPWPEPLPAFWSGQLERAEPLRYVQVEPNVVVEIEADVAFEHQRWRHRVRYVRALPEVSVYDVPLLLGEEEGYFGEQ
nr:ATP-dependent DNA ligase [Micromonospora inaquosa]